MKNCIQCDYEKTHSVKGEWRFEENVEKDPMDIEKS